MRHRVRKARKGVADMRLAAAAPNVLLSDIDTRRTYCGEQQTVGTWIASLTKGQLKPPRWRGGACQLAVKSVPHDSGSDWGAHATLRPLRSNKTAVIEVYFEKPKNGEPGKPYAFRGAIHTPGEGGDNELIRFTDDFEAAWTAIHGAGEPPPRACE